MKKLLNILLLIPCIVLAQVPQGFTYQAVAVGTNGLELVNQNISVRASILSSSAAGDIQWIESHQVLTDDFGLFTLVIGQGTPETGAIQSNFSEIDWGAVNHYIKIEMDVNGGIDYQLLGISQLMSVPYALYAESSGVDSIISEIEEYISLLPDITELSLQVDSLNQLLNNSSDFVNIQADENDTIALNILPNRTIVITGTMNVWGSSCENVMKITDSNFISLFPSKLKGGGWMMFDNTNASYNEDFQRLDSPPSVYGNSTGIRHFYYSFEVSQPMEMLIYFEEYGNSNCSSSNISIQF